MTVPKCILDMMETRTIKEQLRLKLCKNFKNNEVRPKFTGSYKKNPMYVIIILGGR